MKNRIMAQHFSRCIIALSLICFPLFSCFSQRQTHHLPKNTYISDLKILRSGDVHGGIGKDRPYWTDKLIICGKEFKKGVVIHPEDGGKIAFVEYRLPKRRGRLLGVAGWAEQEGAVHSGKMRFRFFVDGELLYGNELNGKECQRVNLDLGSGRVLRIETDDGGDGNNADHMAFGDLRIRYKK
jgi:hypothetical protein